MFEQSLMLLGPPGFGAFERLKRKGTGINLGRNRFGWCLHRRRGSFFLKHGFLFWRDFVADRFMSGGSGFCFLALFLHIVEYRADTLVVYGGRVAFHLDAHVYEFFHQFFVGQPDLFC